MSFPDNETTQLFLQLPILFAFIWAIQKILREFRSIMEHCQGNMEKALERITREHKESLQHLVKSNEKIYDQLITEIKKLE